MSLLNLKKKLLYDLSIVYFFSFCYKDYLSKYDLFLKCWRGVDLKVQF